MTDTLSRNIYRALFSEDQWDLIYNFVGHALDDDDFDPEDVYSIRNKIHALFDDND
jgi:regulator of sirC expression with transglutaminase-like and TPR domain